MEELASLKKTQALPIRPSLSIEQIYGDGFTYNPKLYCEDYGHFSSDILSLEALTGREISVAGNAAVVCHASTVTEGALKLLRKAGLHVPPTLYPYRTEEEYLYVLEQLKLQNEKLIFQYPHPEDKVERDQYWIDPEIQAYLCDKRSIPDLVPREHVPMRKVMSLEQIKEEKPPVPFVLKSGDGRPTSGGCGVMFIEDEKQLEELDESFCDLSQLIVEQFIPYDRNISVHYAVDKNGEISFLGQSEQIVNADGCFRGSWISVDIDDKIADIVDTGFTVMERIAASGYVGFAGFDVLVHGKNYYFIDLNVRFNASTCGLLLYEGIRKNHQKPIMRFCNLEWTSQFEDCLPILDTYVEKGQFIPLSLLDADFFPVDEKICKIVGLVIGNTVEEVEGILREMDQEQLELRE